MQSKGFVVDEDAIVGSMNLQLPEDFAEFVGADSKTGLPSSSTGHRLRAPAGCVAHDQACVVRLLLDRLWATLIHWHH